MSFPTNPSTPEPSVPTPGAAPAAEPASAALVPHTPPPRRTFPLGLAIGSVAVAAAVAFFWRSPSTPPPAAKGQRPAASGPVATPAPAATGKPATPEAAQRNYARSVQPAVGYTEKPAPTPAAVPPPVVAAAPPTPPSGPPRITLNVMEASNLKPRFPGQDEAPKPDAGRPAVAPVANRPPARTLSEQFLPYGTMIRCETVFAVSSDSTENPIIARTTHPVVSPSGVTILPVGTQIHGTAQGLSPIKKAAKLRTGNRWSIVFPKAHREVPAGAELVCKAIALHRGENDKFRASWSMTDGDAGLRGYLLDDATKERVQQFIAAFLAAGASGLQSTTTSVGAFGTSASVQNTPRNAALGGVSASLALEVERLQAEVRASGAYLLVPGGTPFYLYLQSSLDLVDARVGDTSAFVRPVQSDLDEPPATGGAVGPVGGDTRRAEPVAVPQPYGRAPYERTRPASDPLAPTANRFPQ